MATRSLTRAEVREIDRRAIAEFGLPGVVLMENAGRNAAELAARLWPRARHVAVACGRGNNAGDGFVVARHLELLGRAARLLLAADPAGLTGDALVNFTVARTAGIPIVDLSAAGAAGWHAELASSDLVVDALLGTGATGAPRGGIATAIAAIEARQSTPPGIPVFAVDVPSGLDCDSGTAAGGCVRADATGSFVAPKAGFNASGAAAFTGVVHVLDIGVPLRLLAESGVSPDRT
jgi:NAD(P)H-hydrate epimerase